MQKVKNLKLYVVIALLSFLCFNIFVLAGCKKDDNYVAPITSQDYSVDVSATAEKIMIDITNNTEINRNVKVIQVESYEYYLGDVYSGISDYIVSEGECVGQFQELSQVSLEFERFGEDNEDRLFKKYYLVDFDDNFISGPYYVSDIDARYDEELISVTGKKGLVSENSDDILDLACSYTEIEILLNGIIFPNEIYNEQLDNVTLTDVSNLGEDYIQYNFSNKTYYFNKAIIEDYTDKIKYFTENNIKVTLQITAKQTKDQYEIPYFMTYKDAREFNSTSGYMAINTSNEIGVSYWSAIMSFLGDRFSREDMEFGNVDSYIIGSEINFSYQSNPIINYNLSYQKSLNEYMEEYSRQLRLASLAVTQNYSETVVLMPICKWWNGNRTGNGYYKPKLMLDWLNDKSKSEGDFNWGLASHPMSATTSSREPWKDDMQRAVSEKITGDISTSFVSLSNLEVYDIYFSMEENLYNGSMRKVYITDMGINSTGDVDDELQAAAIAYAYYKIANLKSVTAFIYNIAVDQDNEIYNYGLITKDGQEKLSYEVYKYIDTNLTYELTENLISQIQWINRSENKLYSPTTWIEALNTFKVSGFNWDENWNESNIITRLNVEEETTGMEIK